MSSKRTARLDSLARMYDMPLWTLRKLASKRAFPGIIKRGASIYVVVSKFDAWLLKQEVKKISQTTEEELTND